MHRRRRRLSDLFGLAGLILTVVASGALFPGSSVVSAPDTAVLAGPAGGAAAVRQVDPPAVAPHNTGFAAPEGTTSDNTPLQGTPATTSLEPAPAASVPQIAPASVTHVRIPAIGVDAAVLPLDSKPTGKTNAWGGPIYSTLEFPVDKAVRQWVRRGDPNTLPAAESAGDVKAFDRVMLYGHASDIGHHLVFQDLSALKPDDPVIVDTDLGTFTYRVTSVVTRTKTNLNDLAALYAYPPAGEKEIALVACLPDTTSNVVVFGTLADATPAARG